MQSTTITFLPTPLPDVNFIIRGEEEDMSQNFPIASFNGSDLNFEHKLTLSREGTVLQVMTRDENGLFTEALPQNAFGIADEFVGIQLLSPVSGQNGFQYSARIFKDYKTRNTVVPGTLSQIVLTDASNNPPQVLFAQIRHQNGNSMVQEIGFIGTTDMRPALASRVFIRPGETVYVKRAAGGNLIFQF